MEFENLPMPADTVPDAICEACALRGIFHRATKTTAVYCTHTMTGALYPLGGAWWILSGIEAHDFREHLVAALTQGELLGDVAGALARWLLEESKHAPKH